MKQYMLKGVIGVNWRSIYKSRLISAKTAAEKIKVGNRVVFGHAAGEPVAIVKEMMKNKDRYHDVEILHMVTYGAGEYAKPGMEAHFRHNALFVGGPTREAVDDGRADYTPCHLSKIPELFRSRILPIDVLLIQLSPPDEHGYCSFGVSNDYTKPATECAKLIVAEVNDQMPRTLGNSFIHVSEIDFFVSVSYPILEISLPQITDVEQAIGENCASLIEDGSTLQLGIGAIPDAVLMYLKDKKDLGIHSEMISDGVVDLFETGVINNRRKSIHRGKIVITFLLGTKRLYDFSHKNPMLEMYPVDYVNNPYVIMQNYKMTAINSCVQVDFTGQVAAESIGFKQISGVGGQVDFVKGAALSQGGKSIIAMPSTAAQKRISRIVPILDEGAAVTTSRNDVHYIVTEYGIADLKGKTLKQRAEALIGIAHPDFRPQLVAEWEKRFKNSFPVYDKLFKQNKYKINMR